MTFAQISEASHDSCSFIQMLRDAGFGEVIAEDQTNQVNMNSICF